ncbi:MAG TPA: DNA-processing protein DprA [Solirubrobacterales bacterium]
MFKADEIRSPAGLLAIQSVPGVGPRIASGVVSVLDRFETNPVEWEQALARAQQEVDSYRKAGALSVSIFDSAYPARLRDIWGVPPILYVRGSLEVLSAARIVTVTGTRKPTASGCAATEEVVAGLAREGWVVVSSLDDGIDKVAHEAALAHRTETVSVLDSNLDCISPEPNRGLAEEIVDQGGSLVTEYRPSESATPKTFSRRDLIQTGLATAVVITQTELSGRAMHTARRAAMLDRPIFCPTPDSRDKENEGVWALLETPASQLGEKSSIWRYPKSLYRRLGDQPLARPIGENGLEDLDHSSSIPVAQEAEDAPEPTSAEAPLPQRAELPPTH